MSTTFDPPRQALSAEEKRRLLGQLLKQKAARATRFPLSFAQQRLWFLHQLDPASPLYNMFAPFRLLGPLDAAALERALAEIVRRHEVLRTTFAAEAGEPVQVVEAPGAWRLEVEELGALGAEEREAAVRRRLEAEAVRPFDLAAGPLFRARLLRCGAEEHVLLLCVHHVVADGWSMEVVFRELDALYGAFLRGEPSPLPEPPLQYADFAVWQRERLRGPALEQLIGWWREQLAGAPATLELPTDRPRPATQSFRGATLPLALDAALTEKLSRVARGEGGTLFMTLLAAFGMLLARYAGAEEVVVGTPVAGRTRRETEGLVGLFINTLPLRIGLSGDPALPELLGRVRETVLGAHAHQELPFDRLVEELHVERSLGRSPVFQALLSMQGLPRPFTFGGVRAEPVPVESATSKFELSLVLQEEASALYGFLEFSTELFEAATAERMRGHLATLLEGIAADPGRRVSALPLLGAAERRQLLEEWNQVEVSYPAERTLHGLFAEQARRTPEAVAVAYEGEELSYAELERRSNRLANRLRRLGVGPEACVGLCVERSPEMLVGMLGILKAGGAYVPLDPAYPAERLAYVLGDCGAAVLVTQEALLAALPPHAAETVCLDRDRAEIERESAEAPEDGAAPGSLAYVIYTSGSTGRPKGVMVTHACVVRLFRATEAWFGFGAEDVWTLFHSYAFDFSVWEIWGALLHGGRLVVVPHLTSRSPEAFLRLLRREGVTVLNQTPSAFRQLIQAEGDAGDAPGLALRVVVFGGEALELESLRPWIERHGDRRPRLVNMYGITETTVHVTYRPVGRADLEAGRGSVIGRAIPDLRIYLLDAHGQPVPVGVAGELYVGGAGVARGYLNREELTRERFVADPFRPGERVYRSGDLARRLADGELEYLGRADQQVKVRGFRIEPGEIEAALLAQAGVREAVVVARGEGAERRLVAYVAGEGELDGARLRDGVRERLPEYMVPAAVVVLEALPLTPNGKTDRGALPEPRWGVPEEAYVAPRTPVEEVLAGIWAEVLGVERVGAREDFFDLGGHSLLATRVVARAQAALGTEVPLRALFEAPTVAGLAARVEAARREGAGVQARPVVAAPRDGSPLPLSFAQGRLWFIDRLQPGSAAYNMPLPRRLRGPTDARALAGALGEVVRRHESLRTVFRSVGGEPAQVVLPAAPFRLPIVDLGGLPEAAREAEARRQAAADGARPFDLARGPLLRAALLRTGEGEAVLLVNLHHIVSDGWSMAVLFGELSALYAALAAGEPSPLAPLPVQYADYALWQREQLSEETLEGLLRFWRERLRGAPPLLELPTDRPRPQVQGSGAASHRFALSPATSRGLRALARREGATPFMALLAGLQALLGRWSGQDDVVVGTPIAGRTQAELEGLIGFFANTLALRADLSGAGGFAALLGRVREATLGAFAHQELPFERLVEELAPERSLGHSPLFQVIFALQPRDAGPQRLGELATEPFPGIPQSAKFDLALAMEDAGERYAGELLYRRELWDAGTVERMTGHLAALLDAVAADPDAPLREVEILGDAERRQLEGWGTAGARVDAGPPVHERFAQQASRTPDAPAVRSGAEVLSYAELDARAERLAAALGRLGVRPETRVALCTRRGPEMLVGVLGIWKAGGAYVPLDPAYPAERLGFMLADAAVPVLVTQPELADALPEHGAAVVLLDGSTGYEVRSTPQTVESEDDGSSSALSHSRTFALSHSQSLAYVIYTSGSTGRPKGVRVAHGALAATLGAAGEAFGFRAGDEMPVLASFAFDIWLFEALLPLLHGGAVRLVPRERVLDPAALAEELAGATLLHAVPALMRQLAARVRETRGTLPGLRRAFVGGDAVPPELLPEMREAFPAAEVRVLYGPTEGTIICAAHLATGGEAGGRHLLGTPLGNAPLRVLDAAGREAPSGVPGELCIGGASVARDYLGRPELTAERFVPDPFSGEPGARLYRTGDRARWGGDGVLEFLGRLDGQVKIRGFRIEPGEVEAALAAHPGVREAVVAVREDAPGEKRLAAYLVPAEREPVELWPSLGEHFVYDELIYHGLTSDERRHASYRVALERLVPGKVVVDVGTGGDAVLARMCVEAGARHVYAIEIMERSYRLAKRRIAAAGMEDRITLIHGDATRVELPEPADVCVSEIVEAIAGAEGAAAILGSARRFLREGGVFVPERNVTRIAAASLPDALYRRPAFTEVSAHYVERIFEAVGHRFDVRLCIKNFPQENLLSDTGIFEDQDFRGPVECEYDRELTLTVTRDGRFDGFLLWLRLYTLGDEVMDILEHRTAWFPVFFPVFHPGVQVCAGDRIRATCSARLSANGINPDYEIRGSLLRADGEVVPFAHRSAHHEPLFRATPLHALLFRGDEVAVERGAPPARLVDEAREHLRARLPEYMVPSAWVLLDALPLTPNGKPDRRALPAPESGAGTDRYEAPRTPTEEVLAGIWADVLRRERVGVKEDFFELGGHSLLATQVMARAQAALGVDLPLRTLFEAPTVEALARHADALLREGAAPAAAPIVALPRDGRPLPLSFAQQRLWLIDRLEPGRATYGMAHALRLRGALDARALAAALTEIVRRHEVLRTVFVAVEGEPLQVVRPAAPFLLPTVDLGGLPEDAREAEARRLAAEDASRPFDLERGPPIRAALLRLREDGAVLLGNMHHVVSDGWSMGVYFRELSALYGALAAGEPSPLPEPPVQYADYAVWQRAHLTDAALEGSLGYWRERLAGAPPLLELPTDRLRPAVAGDRGAAVDLALAPEAARALRALARREGATLFAVLLAGFQALLARYAGTTDVLVGTAVGGRPRLETEGLIGFFVNTLVLRGDLSGDSTGRALVGQARERVLEAHAHQDVPFERLVEELRVERTRAHAPLFQVMFTFEDAAAGEVPPLGGVEVEPVRAHGGREKFDLTLAMREDGERLAGGISYRTDLWERAGMERLAGHLALLLEELAREPGRRVAELPLLRAAEREQVVEAWNRTARPYPRGVCIHELFEAQAAARPHAPALVWEDVELSYAELDARANRLARHLAGLGVRPETRVGVLLERGPELIVALLAVLKAGGCYVPLDPGYPAERLRTMLDDSRAAVLIGRGELAFAAEGGDPSVVHLDRAADALARESADAPRGGATAENLAYIVYTSGSTGRPKGVMVGHREVVQLVVETDYVRLRPGDRVAQASNASFDALTFEAWGALMNGATLVGIPRDVLLAPAALRRTLRSQGITTLYQTTALLNQHSGEQGDVFASVREVLFGGQAADAASLRRLLRAGGPRRLLHVYGPTETTAWCSYEQVEHVAEDARTVTVGGPTGNARIYVLNRALEPEPVGVPGEAYVGGGGVVRGYLERPELTAERFLPDPFAAEPGARMYRTGDRMRWRAEGTLEFIGRVDEQVKIRGFRIEPGEVESAVAAHPGVREARVVVREDAPGEKRLVAYLVGRAGAEEVREHLRRSLPEYMVPAALVPLDAIPLTPNGKLDVRALPAPEYASEDRYVAPRTPTEEVLAGIWADVLRLEAVGVRDGFFELGGHSLLATRVVARAQAALGVELPLRALFDAPTVEGLAQRADALLREGAPTRPAAPILAASRDGSPLPLSFAQQRLWFIDRLEPGSPAYNLAFPLRLRGAVDARALAAALGEIVRRHEALRTVFRAVEGGPVQVILPAAPSTLPAVDLGGLPEEAREAEARRLAAEDASRPFDLERGPLLRAALLRLGDSDSVLLGGMHHIVGDGWSMGVLFRELSALYAAFAAGEPSPLPDLPVQYADFTAWQRAHLTDAALEGQLGYWRERLAGMPPLLELPTDRPRPPVASDLGGAVGFALPAETAAALRALARREGATLFAVLLAGFQALLARYAGTDDVPVGTAVAGRTRLETEGLIGFFVNTLVLRGDFSEGPTGRALVGQARERMLEAHVHQDVPFEKLVEELRVERTRAHSPLFQAMFTFGPGAPGEGLRLGPVEVEPLAVQGAREKFDLTLGMGGEGDDLAGGLSYRTDLWEAATIQRMAGHFAALLEGLAREPERRVAELPLLDGAERRRVLEEWNATERDYPADACVHDLFRAQAARTPDAVAVSWRGEPTSYAGLERRANRLAHALRRRGVGPESRVGVCLPRTPELLAALLGVLGAGGAYVPLDPAYPRERLGWMVEDAGIGLVLTESGLAGRLPQGAADLLLLDRVDLSAEPDGAPASGVGPENLSHVIFTSGSTGRPKGVMIRHSSTVVLLHWLRETVSDEERSALLFSTSVSFDVSVAEIFGTLCWGGKLVLVENALELATVSEPVVYASMVPSAAAELLRSGGIPASVRTLNLGGEALTAATARGLYALPTVERVGNLYGPTEDTTYSTYSRVEPGAERVSIGRPVANTRAYVLDAELEPSPAGVPGELYLAGAGLARGYASRPELTAERWLPDPFGAPGGRMYRVMDRARRRADGELEYLGRTDHQVKVRGFRIELGEVEAALLAHPGVREAAAVVREDAPGDRRIVAYVTGEDVSAAELRAHAAERLPEYMVPSALVRLAAFPLTPNGKTDRRALPAPEYAAEAGRYEAPRTPAEEILAGIWADVLGVERVGVRDGFFELGGHSLLATRVTARAQASLGVELPLRAMFEAPTLEALAQRADALLREDAGPAAAPLLATPRDGSPLPLSFAQQRLWFIDRLEPGSPAYNMPHALRLRGALDARALAGALTEIVRRHEALRTVFVAVEGEPAQVVRPAAPFPLPTADLARLPEAAREAEARRLAGEDASRPFDLERGPLLRAVLLRLAREESVLLGNMHHVVSDGWSLGVYFRELSALYGALADGRDAELPELPVQYADFAAWQRAHLTDRALEGQLGYWRERLAGMPPLLELPTDRPRPPVASDRGGAVELALSPETTQALRALARREGATVFSVLLAGFQALLARYAGTDDVPVGTAVAGRTRLETEGLIGFFVNTLVLRGDFSQGPTGRALVGQARERVLEAHAHQDVPFERLVEELRVERTRAHAPLFQAMFTFDAGSPGEALRLGDVEVEALGTRGAREKFDLTLGMGGEGERLSGGLSYRSDLWEAATIQRMAGHFAALLEGLARGPERRVAELPLLDGAERRRIVEEWGRAPGARAPGGTMHALVAAQAARAPEAVALVYGGERLSYAELERRAGRLASHLRRLGVGPESRVGVCLERSPEMAVALLAILQAGGAYVPLDPAYPRERLAWMLADSGADVLVTVEPLLERCPRPAGATVCLDRDAAAVARESEAPPAVEVSPEGLAFLVYTSGSTGEPKGTEVPHRAVPGVLLGVDYARFGPGETLLHHSSTSWDALVLELWGALLAGGTCVLYPGQASEPGLLGEQVREHGVTTLWLTSAYFNLVVDTCPEVLAGVRQVMTGGDAVSAPHLRRARELYPELRLVDGYGPSECTVFSTCWVVPEDFAGATVPIGRPVGDRRVHLLDPHGEPVPVGVPGELFVGGPAVGRGYRNRPELTAAKFVPDPFSGEPGARLYRTGDLARWRPDGDLEFVGRADFQVKIRGFRVEPGEVEAVLAGHPAVREAAVVVREDAGERRLVAYAVAEAGAEPSPEGLRAWLGERLPEYMVPSALVLLERLPLTPHGKTDRRALPAPEWGGAEEAYVAPRTPAEELLAGIWAAVLGRERVGARDDFFALGGHSLLAVRLLARVERATGVRLPLAVLFTAPTVEALAAELGRGRAEDPGSPLVPIRPEGEGTPLFLVHPVGGNVLAYAALARHLEPGRPVYALRSRGLAPGEEPAGSLEEMAADYLRAVRGVQPAGPYRVGGWSMGGVVAFEMARQLEAAGERVATLALIDSHLPALHGRPLPEDEPTRVRIFAADLGLAPGELALPEGGADGSCLRRVLRSAHAAGVLPADVDAERMERLYAVFRSNLEALQAYPGGPYGGAVLLLRAAERDPADTDTLGWERLAAGGVELRTVPGSHFTLVREPHAAALAALLEERPAVNHSKNTEETGCR